MKSKLIKGLSIFLGGMIMFTACEDEDNSPNLGDAVGLWDLTGLKGTYNRKIINKTGVKNTADKYPLVANWKDAAAFGAALQQAGVAITPEYVVAATAQTLTTFLPGGDAPGFPREAVFDAAALKLAGIQMKVDLLDSKSATTKGTYTVKGTYPSLRLDPDKCKTYLMLPPPQINDTGDWFANYETGAFELAPVVDIDQVLPPFADGKFTVNREVDPATFNLQFTDRDSHDELFAQVKPGKTWDTKMEEDKRVITGIDGLPLNAAGGYDPAAKTDASSEGYIMQAALAPWGGYLTFYALNVLGELKARIADTKNPLTDLDGSGSNGKDDDGDGVADNAEEKIPTGADLFMYMLANIQAGNDAKTGFGIPYSALTDLGDGTDPTKFKYKNDSGADWKLAAWTAGGKMMYQIQGLCMPVNETIFFNSDWTEVEDHDHDHD